MKISLRSNSRWAVLLTVMFLAILIYLPGLYGGFEFDDGANILDNPALKVDNLSRESILSVAVSGRSGPLGRSVSMLSFAANYYFTELEPFFFKLTNLFIHLIAGLGVYLFIRQLTLALNRGGEDKQVVLLAHLVGLTTAGLWLVHPLNVTSVLYIVQRMTSLAALFTFFALALYVLGRRKLIEGGHGKGLLLILLALGPLTGLATLSKENGALAPYLMLCVELAVFRFECREKRIRLFLYALFSAIVLIPVAMALVNYERLISYIASGYLQRDFSMTDRLLTQPQVLMFYLRLLLMPNAGQMGIYHDDFPISSSLTQSPGVFISAGAILLLIIAGLLAIRKAPALAIGILWFFVGHSLESTFLALEMVHEHRNYLPIVGPIFVASYYFWRSDFTALPTRAKGGIAILVVAVFSVVTYIRSVEWSNLVDHAAIEVHNHPHSTRANYQMGRMYFMLYLNDDKNMGMVKLADKYFARAAALERVSILPITAMIQTAYKSGIEPAPDLVGVAAKRLQYGRSWEPNMVALANLVSCQVEQYCRIADTDMTALILAAIANPDASRGTKGAAHSLLGGYYANRMGNLELAAPHIKAAVDSEPDRIDFRLELARLYVAIDDPAAAGAELAVARKLDKWSLHAAEITKLNERLDLALSGKTSQDSARALDDRARPN